MFSLVASRKVIITVGIACALSACDNGGSNQGAAATSGEPEAPVAEAPSVDDQLAEVIVAQGLTGSAIDPDTMPAPDSALATLGRRLFFSKSLSGDRDVACVSCHHPSLGGGDNLSLPIGVGAEIPELLGPGRYHSADAPHYDGGPTVPRNAPTTFNIAGYQQTIFHDGRLERVEGGISTPDSGFNNVDAIAGDNLAQAQSRFPVTSREEMKGFGHDGYDNQGIRNLLAGRLGGYGDEADILDNTSYWIGQFRTVFDAPDAEVEALVTEANISFAIGAYENSQVLTNSPWANYVRGDTNALTDDAKAGALLFYGDAGCGACHSGDFFTDEGMYNIAAPQIGRGKGHGNGIEDFGRAAFTGLDEDMYKFRAPSLLNVEVTGPWTHAGAYTSLEAVVRHHLNPQQALDNFSFEALTQLGIQNLDRLFELTEPALARLEAEQQSPEAKVLRNVELSDEQVGQVVAFLESLTDPCAKDRDCLAQWIADEVVDIDPNGDLLIAVDEGGASL